MKGKCEICGKWFKQLTTDGLCEVCFSRVIDNLCKLLDMSEEPCVVIRKGKIDTLSIMSGAAGHPSKSNQN